jgi:hypothetical protein
LIIPASSGYGPSVSDGVTAHVDDDVVVEELGLAGDDAESQAVVNTIPASPPNASRASRLFNFARSLDFIAHPFT